MSSFPVPTMPPPPVGVVGLGQLGGSLAAALVAAGRQVTGWDVDPAAREAAAARGVRVARDMDGVVVLAVPLPAMAGALEGLDADKTGYADYVDQLHPRMTDNGVVLLDNTLRGGRVLDPQTDDDRALVELNAALAVDPRWETVLLPLSDGLTMLRRR